MLFINLTEKNEFNAHNGPTHATKNQLHLVFIFLSLQAQVVKRLVIPAVFGQDVAVDSNKPPAQSRDNQQRRTTVHTYLHLWPLHLSLKCMSLDFGRKP